MASPGLWLNLIAQPAERRWSRWGRVIFYVTDVDVLYERALGAGYEPATVPRDAEWGERFFHLVVRHSDFDVLIPSHSRMGKFSGGKRISMLRGTPGRRRMKPLRSRVTII